MLIVTLIGRKSDKLSFKHFATLCNPSVVNVSKLGVFCQFSKRKTSVGIVIIDILLFSSKVLTTTGTAPSSLSSTSSSPTPSSIVIIITDLEILLSTLFFSSKALMVTGRVAELEAVPNAVTIALPMFAMKLQYEGEEKYEEKYKKSKVRMRKIRF